MQFIIVIALGLKMARTVCFGIVLNEGPGKWVDKYFPKSECWAQAGTDCLVKEND